MAEEKYFSQKNDTADTDLPQGEVCVDRRVFVAGNSLLEHETFSTKGVQAGANEGLMAMNIGKQRVEAIRRELGERATTRNMYKL